MSTPAIKRRRVDAANTALSRPFRSPFKQPVKVGCQNNFSIATKSREENDELITVEPLLMQSLQPVLQSKTSAPSQILSTPKRAIVSRISVAAFNTDPDIAPLMANQQRLQNELRELKEELNIAEQARRIEADSEKKQSGGKVDGELLLLTQTWRAASRQAAEDLFTGVKDKVNRVGGPRAWKEMQQRQQESRRGFNDDIPQPSLDNEDENNGDKRDCYDRYAGYDVDPETENEKNARENNAYTDDECAEDEFTMAVMLRALNVDLKIIGYDKSQQRWEA